MAVDLITIHEFDNFEYEPKVPHSAMCKEHFQTSDEKMTIQIFSNRPDYGNLEKDFPFWVKNPNAVVDNFVCKNCGYESVYINGEWKHTYDHEESLRMGGF